MIVIGEKINGNIIQMMLNLNQVIKCITLLNT